MKKSKLALASAISVVAAGLFAFNVITAGSIKGTVTPADAATRAWALSSSDTLRASVNQGTYEIKDAKPGSYRIIIEAKPPYKNAAKDSVTVADGQATEVGEIKLEQ